MVPRFVYPLATAHSSTLSGPLQDVAPEHQAAYACKRFAGIKSGVSPKSLNLR